MKLTKENVYINLQGKSKEELTDLYDFLKINNEPIHRTKERFLEYDNYYLSFFGKWQQMFIIHNEVEVTIEQLKKIIKPMENKGEQLRKEAKERGYTHDNFKCLIYKKSKGIGDIDKWHYCNLSDRLYTNVLGEGGNVVYREGVWAEIVSESLEQQLQKAEAEVNRLKYLIEKDNRPKVGDWAILWEEGEETPVIGLITDVTDFYLTCNGSWENGRKITDQELINKLNELMK